MVSPSRPIPSSSELGFLPGRSAWLVAFVLILVVLPMLSGCGSQAAQPKPVAQNVEVAIAEDSVNLGAGETHQFSATVTGSTNTAIAWRLSGCTGTACGTISPTGFYTAPSSIVEEATMTVTATSQADPSKFDTVTVHHMPIAVSITPPGSAMVTPGATLNFTASVQYDLKNAGVAWDLGAACSEDTCGRLSNVTPNSVTYTAPASMPTSPTVALTATSITDSSKTARTAITISPKGGLAAGDYAFLFQGWQLHFSGGFYTPSSVAIAGHFHADANGNITDGVEDIDVDSGVSRSLPFTGTYGVGSDHRGSLTFSTTEGSATYRMTVDASGSKAKFIKYDGLPLNAPISGSGYFELQDKAAFSLSALAGPYAIGVIGGFHDWAGVGRFTANAAGILSGGMMDVTVATYAGTSPQTNYTNLTLTGSFNAPSSSTGRGTATVTLTPPPKGAGNFSFAYYIISDGKILLVEKDTTNSPVPVLSGEVRRQNGTFSVAAFDSPVVFSMAGVNGANYGVILLNVAIGQIVPDGSGNIAGTMDQNDKAAVTLNRALTGSYFVDPGGRATIDLQLGTSKATTHIAYLFGENEGFLMQTSGTDVLFGRIKPQAAGPFTAASVSGTFISNTSAPPSESAKNYSGLTTFDGASAVSAILDTTHWDELHHNEFTGAYTVSANGRGMLTFTGPSEMVFWAISPTELVSIATVNSGDYEPVLLECER